MPAQKQGLPSCTRHRDFMQSRLRLPITHATSVQTSSNALYCQSLSPSARLPLGHNIRRHVVSVGGNRWIMSGKTCSSQGFPSDGGGYPQDRAGWRNAIGCLLQRTCYAKCKACNENSNECCWHTHTCTGLLQAGHNSVDHEGPCCAVWIRLVQSCPQTIMHLSNSCQHNNSFQSQPNGLELFISAVKICQWKNVEFQTPVRPACSLARGSMTFHPLLRPMNMVPA